MNRKGIAPLVSTIVLILFAAGLGIIVMNWGTAASYAIEEANCEEASIKVIEINNKAEACFKDNMLYFTLENSGEATVDGLKISFIGDIIYQTNSNEKYFVEDIKKSNIGYQDIGPLLKVKIAPVMGVDLCIKQSTSIENIEAC